MKFCVSIVIVFNFCLLVPAESEYKTTSLNVLTGITSNEAARTGRSSVYQTNQFDERLSQQHRFLDVQRKELLEFQAQMDKRFEQLNQRVGNFLAEVQKNNIRIENQCSETVDAVKLNNLKLTALESNIEKINGALFQANQAKSTRENQLKEVLNKLEVARETANQIENKITTVNSALTLLQPIGGCGAPKSGRISSPNHPEHYDPNTNRSWYISAPECHKIRITLEYLHVENGTISSNGNGKIDCIYDFLEAVEPKSGHMLFKRCGRNVYPSSFISTSNEVAIIFKSDHSNNNSGFSLFYESYADTPPAPVPSLTFYKEFDFKGDFLTTQIMENKKCSNFPLDFVKIGSVNTDNRCILLWTQLNCTGRFWQVYPGDQRNSHKLQLSPTSSYSSCLNL